MANVVKHRFASAKANGPDATQIQPSHWNDGHAFSGGNAGDLLVRDPTDATYGATWAPPPVAPGQWVDVSFNAANFSATGGTWTVTAGSVGRYSYAIFGKTLLLQFYITGTTIGGSPTSLNIQLPAAIKQWQGAVFATNIGNGVLLQQNAGIIMTLFRDILGTPWPAGTIHGPVGSLTLILS